MKKVIYLLTVLVFLASVLFFVLYDWDSGADIPTLTKVRVCEYKESKECEKDVSKIMTDSLSDILISFNSQGFHMGYAITVDYYMKEGGDKVELLNTYYPQIEESNFVILRRPYDTGWLSGTYVITIRASFIQTVEGINNLFTKMFIVSPF